jgi:hypothetical protein
MRIPKFEIEEPPAKSLPLDQFAVDAHTPAGGLLLDVPENFDAISLHPSVDVIVSVRPEVYRVRSAP